MLYTLLLIIYFFLFAYLSYKKPQWAVFIILAALPSYAVRFNIWIMPMTAMESMILLSFITWLIKKIYSDGHNGGNAAKPISNFQFLISNFKKSPNSKFKISNTISQFLNFLISNVKIIFPVILFLVSATISIFISPDKTSALGIWKAYFIEPVLFLIVFIDVLKNARCPQKATLTACHPDQATEERVEVSIIGKAELSQISIIHFTAFALAIPAIYISLFAIYQKFTGAFVPAQYWQPNYHRVTSFFSYPNAIGLLLAPIIMILFGAFIYEYNKTPRHPEGAKPSDRRIPWLTFKPLSYLAHWNYAPAPSTQDGARNDTYPRNKLFPLFYALTIILSLAAIIFAKSEGALIALIAGFFIFAFLYNKKSRIAAGIIIFLILLSGSGICIKHGKDWNALFSKTNLFELDNACLNISPFNKGGLKGIFKPNSEVFCKLYQKLTLKDVSGTIRRNMWQETFSMLKDRPIFGAGLAGYQTAMTPYHTKNYVEIYLYPHNILLNFWSETGLIGLIAFIWLIILFYYYGLKLLLLSPLNRDETTFPHFEKEPALSDSRTGGKGDFYRRIITITLLSAMSVLLIHGLVDAPYFKNDLAILFWIIWGMMFIIKFII